MPRDEAERKRRDVRVMLSLPPEIAERLKERAHSEATPVSVLVRQWVVRELRRGQGGERAGHDLRVG